MNIYNEITLGNKDDFDSVIFLLKKYGILVFPDFISLSKCSELMETFNSIYNNNYEWAPITEYSKGKCCRVTRTNIDQNKYSSLYEIFSSKWMESITHSYLGKNSFLNHEIFLVNDVPNSSHVAQDLHYDRIPTLKFFIYLTNTTSENGSFYCVPGSQINTKEIEQENRKSAILPNINETRDNASAYNGQEIPIEGKAGTLIIFDTDVLHRAGKVSTGERYVMRGHSRKDVYASNFQHKKKLRMYSLLRNLFQR